MKTLGKRKDMLRPWFWFLLHNVNSSECNLCDGHCLRNKLGGSPTLGGSWSLQGDNHKSFISLLNVSFVFFN